MKEHKKKQKFCDSKTVLRLYATAKNFPRKDRFTIMERRKVLSPRKPFYGYNRTQRSNNNFSVENRFTVMDDRKEVCITE